MEGRDGGVAGEGKKEEGGEGNENNRQGEEDVGKGEGWRE